MTSRASKRAAPVDKHVLCAGVLRDVLELVGPGHALYVSTVCKAWHNRYQQVTAVTLAVVTRDGRSLSIDSTPATTFLSAAFSSPATVRWARRCGLRLKGEACAYIAGRYADISTLAEAHALGLSWSATLLNSVAAAQKLEALE
jgi:hypothetical protein